jgi:D-arabinose 1-dehydrogenase-like Zn-dependent alcohol dehydrogenase
MTIHAYAALAAREALSTFQYDPPDLQPHEVEIKITH